MIQIVYIISDIDKAIAFEWLAENIDKTEFEIKFIFLGKSMGKSGQYLQENGFHVQHIRIVSKKNYLKAIWKLALILKKLNPDIVHTHLRTADLLGLTAARYIGVKKRITTRHSSTYNHIWHPSAVRTDRYINRTATTIIAISKVVLNVLTELESVEQSKTKLVPHGFEIDEFQSISNKRIADIKSKYKIPDDRIIIGVIARHIEWKGIQYVIQSLSDLRSEGKRFCLILANASGPYTTVIMNLLQEFDDEEYLTIEFEPDFMALYKVFDLYIHVPIDPQVEAFGQTYVEALASGIPSIFTLSGIAHEFIVHERNAIVVPHCNSKKIAAAIKQLIEDETLRKNLIRNGKEDIKRFELSRYIHQLEDIYRS